MLHIKGDYMKLKYSQFKKMSLRYFEQLYFWIPLPIFLVLLFIIIVLLWHFLSFKHCPQSCSFLKNPSEQDRILTGYIGWKEIDGISLSSRLCKWTKWNNRLVMLWAVWCGGAKKYFKKIMIAKLTVHDCHFFFSFERIFLLQYYTRKTKKEVMIKMPSNGS